MTKNFYENAIFACMIGRQLAFIAWAVFFVWSVSSSYYAHHITWADISGWGCLAAMLVFSVISWELKVAKHG
jgi:hypothetical protein